MRELVKNLGSFSIAMTAFGAQQVWNLARQPAPGAGHPTVQEIDSVSRAASQQLGSMTRNAFEAGDRVQRSVVDLVYGVVTLEALDPNRLLRLSTDVVRESTGAVRQILPLGNAPSAAPSNAAGTENQTEPGQPCGWGPMPPLD